MSRTKNRHDEDSKEVFEKMKLEMITAIQALEYPYNEDGTPREDVDPHVILMICPDHPSEENHIKIIHRCCPTFLLDMGHELMNAGMQERARENMKRNKMPGHSHN